MNQVSAVGFGSDINVLAGYAQAANDRLGNIDFVFENTGPNDAVIVMKAFDNVSGYNENVGPFINLVPRGTRTLSYSLLDQRVGFFGSGDTTVNISSVIRNKADLRGAQIDIVAAGRRGYGFDKNFDEAAFRPAWGAPPDRPDLPVG
jgi:hypothetical protein